jgi:hypothetical protein
MNETKQPQAPQVPENNVALTGDEARVLIASLSQSGVQAPAAAIISLYLRLMNISQVQPPKQQ